VSDTTESVLLVEDVGPVRRLTMNRPEALNALNHDLTQAISAAIASAGADENVSVVILRGAGRAFCSGYDLAEDADEGELDARQWHASLAGGMAGMLEILDCPKPVLASVQSYCLAGGTDLMLACDIAVVADDAKFGYVDIRFGSGVVSMLLPWVVGVRKAKELLFTGEDRIPADEALRIGLVNRVVPAGQEVEAALGMAGLWARRAPLSLWFAKNAVNVGLAMPLEAALAFEIGLTAQLFTTDDRVEGLRAFRERREAEFRGR
jgi:enoyl-CoA hydratase/carnithine racemase